MKRENLIPYKTKNNKINNEKDILITNKYNKNFDFLKTLFSDCFYTMKKEIKANYLEEINLKNIYSVNTSIGSLFIHNFKLENIYNFNNKKCYNKKCYLNNCLTCNYINQSYKLDVISKYKIEKIIIPCLGDANCMSAGVVYIIFCNKCNVYYIGETGRTVSARLSEHIKNIKNFKKDINLSLSNYNKVSEVAIHFNKDNHSLINFNFFIFKINLLENEQRKSIETDLINIFVNLGVSILNKPNKIPSSKYIKNFAFR